MNFDVGYGQVNSTGFARLGVTGRALLDPCTNLKAAAAVLTQCYARAAKDHGEGQTALLHALSCYNTGSQTRGFDNGYVSAVVAQARILQIPALTNDAGAQVSEAQTRFDGSARSSDAIGKKNMKAVATGMATADGDQGAFAQGDPGAFGPDRPQSP